MCVCVRESGSVSLLADPRVNLLTNGGLEIANVTHADEGFYTCSVVHTNMSINAVLEILSEWCMHADPNPNPSLKPSLNPLTALWKSEDLPKSPHFPKMSSLCRGHCFKMVLTKEREHTHTESQYHIPPVFSLPDRTVILSPPQALKVLPGSQAIFTCLALVDPKLGSPLIQWRKNNQKLYESQSDQK